MARFLGSIAVAALAVSGVVADAANLKQKPLLQYIQYSSVPGYFVQDDPSTNPSTFDFVRRPFHFRDSIASIADNGVVDWNQLWFDQSNLPRRRRVRLER
jgi:hypothetical protein